MCVYSAVMFAFMGHCAGVFSIYLARIDIIVGPPAPSTPSHKKYATKGPKDSTLSPHRLGLTRLHLSCQIVSFFLLVRSDTNLF